MIAISRLVGLTVVVVLALVVALDGAETRAAPALVEDAMSCPLVAVQGPPGVPTRLKIARGRLHGVERGARGSVMGPRDGTYTVIARVEVEEVQDLVSWLRVVPAEPAPRHAAIAPGLSVDLPVRLPATLHRGLLYRLLLLDITFLDDQGRPLVDPLILVGPDAEAAEGQVLSEMAALGRHVRAAPEPTRTVTRGPWRGQAREAIMEHAGPDDYRAFLRFVLGKPGAYARRSWKITEAFAAWIADDMPSARADTAETFIGIAAAAARSAYERGNYRRVIDEMTPLVAQYAAVEATGQHAPEAAMREMVSRALRKLGETDRARELLSESAKRAAAAGDVRWQAQTRYELGELYYATSRYDLALDAYAEAAELARAAGDTKREARGLMAAGQAGWALGRRDAAFAAQEQAMRVREQSDDDSELPWQLLKVAELEGEVGDRDAARAALERALAHARARGATRDEADVLAQLGWLSCDLSDPDGTERAFQAARALNVKLGRASEEGWSLVGEAYGSALRSDFEGAVQRIAEAITLGDRIGEVGLKVRARRAQAGWLVELERRDEAARVLEEALAAAGGDIGLRADVLAARARQRLSGGALQLATDDANEAMKLAESTKDAARRLAAGSLLAAVHNARGEYALGLEVLAGVKRLAREVGNRPQLAAALRDTGWQLASLGRLAEAREAVDEALALAEQNGDPVARARGLTVAARIAQAYGDLQEELRALGEAGALYHAAGLRADEAVVAANRGLAVLELRDFDGALKLFDDARRLAGAKGGADLDIMIDAHRGWALGQLGRAEEADQALEAAIARARESAFERVAGLLGLYGEVLAQRGDLARAIPLLELGVREADAHTKTDVSAVARLGVALERAGRAKEAEPVLREAIRRGEATGGAIPWEPLYRLGKIEAERGRTRAALKTLERAAAEIERGEGPLEDDAARARYWGDKAGVYTLLVRLLLSERRDDDALKYVERAKVAELQSLDRSRRSGLELELDLSEARFARELQAERRKKAPNADKIRRLDALLAGVLTRRSEFMEEVRRDAGAHTDRYTIHPLELDKLRKLLPPDMLILSPVALEDELVVFAMTRDASTHFTVRIAATEVDALVQAMLAETSPGGRLKRGAAPMSALPSLEAIVASRERLTSTAKRLYDLLVRPALERFGPPGTLVISPSASLRYLPFAALHDGTDWLVSRTTLIELTSLDQTKFGRGERASFKKAHVLAIADPDGSLEGARREVREIQAVYPDADVLEDAAATMDALNARVAYPGFEIVHLATHGVLAPEAERSHLVLAGAPLYYRSIPALRFAKTKLVILSACDTASRGTGAEVTGLAYQFEQTDVRATVATLWPVDDDATMALMGELYRHLRAGLSPQEALARAQRSLAAQSKTEHPYYWAAFVLIGAP